MAKHAICGFVLFSLFSVFSVSSVVKSFFALIAISII